MTVDKARLGSNFNTLDPQALTIELVIGLTMHASELDIANEVLIIDGATPSFCRQLRIQFSERSKREERIRPFKNIVGGDSKREDGLQLADMIAGALRLHVIGISSDHFDIISPRIVDLCNQGRRAQQSDPRHFHQHATAFMLPGNAPKLALVFINSFFQSPPALVLLRDELAHHTG